MPKRCRVFLVLWAAIGCGGGGGAKAPSDLTVAGSPSGKAEGQVRVVLAFSRPMVARDRIDQPVAAPPIAIAPPIEAEARWSDDKTLVLVPKAKLAVSTRFAATVPAGTKALDGSELDDAVVFEFTTERLTAALEVVGSTERTPREPTVKVAFNHEVPADQVAQHCGFDAGPVHHAAKLAADSNQGPARFYTVAPVTPLAVDTAWTVGCRAELHGSVGNLGLEAAVVEKFRTYGPLRFSSLKPDGNDIVPDEGQRLAIAFTNPLKPPYKLTLTPAVPGFPQQCHELGESPGLSCGALLEAQTAYTLVIDPAQQDIFGQTLDKKQELAFRTADAKPTISMDSGYFVAELTRPVLPVWTRNVGTVELTAVEITQANFHELRPLLDWWKTTPADFSKTKLAPRAKQLAIAGTKNQWGQRPIDPAELFGKKPGPGMYYVEVGSPEVDKPPFESGGRQKVLVNFTDIGVVSKLSGARGLVWASRLSTGKPLAGATVSVRDGAGRQTWSGTTDAEGVAMLPPSAKLGSGDLRIFVQHQADWTMVNPERNGGLAPWSFNVSYEGSRAPSRLRGFMHTDRGLYRPGDKVHVKGLARITKLGEPLAPPASGSKVSVEVAGPQGKTVVTAEARTSPFGGFWFDIDLPGDARLGDYELSAKLDAGTFTRSFSVEAYRPATFEVTAKTQTARVLRRDVVRGTLAASYLYGAPMRSGKVDIAVHSRPRRAGFAGYPGFQFADERTYESYYDQSEVSQSLITEDHLALDAAGNASIAITVGPNDIHGDADLLVAASVASPSHEVITKTFTVPYFRSTTYFGIKSPGYFVDITKPQRFEIVAVTPDGKAIDSNVKATITRRDWNCVWEDWGYRGSYQCKDTTQTIVTKQLAIVAGKPATIEFTPTTGGQYYVVVEGGGETATAAVPVYAWGDGGGSWQSTDTLAFDILTDKQEYKIGDTATLILKTDLAEATGLVTIERDGVIEKRLIQVSAKAKHLTVPITAAYAPNVYVSVALVQGRLGTGPRGKPRMRMGIANLRVVPQDNKLVVAIATDRKDYRPGAQVSATIKVTDEAGKPVSAEVSITAADEGVLSLIGFETPNPVPAFYAPWGLGVSTATQFEYIKDIPGPNVERPATGGDAVGTLRSRFVATAVWAPGAVTNAAGIATVTFAAPDNLTAFRIMAVAADKGTRFGSADKRFTVSKPLQLHQSLPRFVNLGDALTAGVVVHNETGKAGTATVKLVADKHVAIKGAAERTVALAKAANAPVLFELSGRELGTSKLAFSVTMNGESDAVELALPVQQPSPLRVHHVADGAVRTPTTVPVALPANAIAGSAELIVALDPDGLSGIDKGLAELIEYPHGCLEQTTSKVIPMIAVRELADTMNLAGLSGPALDGFVKEGIAKIGRHQTTYGGFSLWPGGEPNAFYTAYALWGLHIAKQAGYPVDQTRIAEALEYLRNDGLSPSSSGPHYSEMGDQGSQAFALYVRALLGDKDTQAATRLLAKPLPIYGKAFLARALAAGLGPKDPAVVKLVAELAAIADAATKANKLVDEPEKLDSYMSSSFRTTAMILAALVEIDPKHASIKPLVHTIMAYRRAHESLNTQENLFSLLALTSYARAYAAQAPAVTLTLGTTTLVTGPLAGKQRMRVVTVPLPAAAELKLDPKGEVHYSLEIRYRAAVATIKPESHGLQLRREYLDEAGVAKTSFQVGDVVVVRLTTEVPAAVSHLMVWDAIPAGFEAINPRLATAGRRPTHVWGQYRELFDDHASFALEYTSEGTLVNEYVMRAIAVGTFTRPPAVAELMYDAGTFARTGVDQIEVTSK
ncbi:MAG: MG2 domain-containing protein [Kofleriaceae bacterium]